MAKLDFKNAALTAAFTIVTGIALFYWQRNDEINQQQNVLLDQLSAFKEQATFFKDSFTKNAGVGNVCDTLSFNLKMAHEGNWHLPLIEVENSIKGSNAQNILASKRSINAMVEFIYNQKIELNQIICKQNKNQMARDMSKLLEAEFGRDLDRVILMVNDLSKLVDENSNWYF